MLNFVTAFHNHLVPHFPFPHFYRSSSSILFTKYSNKQKHVTYREISNMALTTRQHRLLLLTQKP